MYKYNRLTESNSGTQIKCQDITEGEHIETRIAKIAIDGIVPDEGSPLIYTDRKDGVVDMYNIRTDKFETLIESKDMISKARASDAIEANIKAKKAREAAENSQSDGNRPTQES